MELDFRKKSRQNNMIRSKSFEQEGSRIVERLSHLMDGNNGRCLPDGRKEMQRPGKIENVKKKIHARARKVL